MRTNGASRAEDQPEHPGGIAPEDSFLVQIRGGSRPAEQAISGRVEHLHSGDSEQFGSMSEMLAFVARHFGSAARGPG